MTADPEKKRRWFQVHLSTAIVLMFASGLSIWWIVGVLGRARMSARMTSDKSNVSQIARAITLYSEQNGIFPNSLEDLFPSFLNDSRVFLSPLFGPGEHRLGFGKIEHCDYVLIPRTDSKSAWFGLVFGPRTKNGGRNLGLGGGSVEYIDEEDFRKRMLKYLKEQKIDLEVKDSISVENQKQIMVLRQELGLE